MRVLFFGTPHFACQSLQALIDAEHEIVGVVTRADKPVGRGRKLTPPPTKVLALENNLPVLQPKGVNRESVLDEFRALKPDVVVVVAFGAILKRPLLDLAPMGAINVHGSLLPAYRGVAPVQWSLIHGERMAGVTTMIMDEGVDTGPSLLRYPVEVGPFETAGELLERLGQLGGELLVKTLAGLESGEVTPTEQTEEGASYAPKLLKPHGFLNLKLSAVQVFDQFRGVTPAPGARCFWQDVPVLVEAMRPVVDVTGAPYEVLEVGSRHLRLGTGDGAIDLLSVRPAGKKTMDAAAFARGRSITAGQVFSQPPELPDLSPRIAVTP
ncbi:MAG: methionyl-tRNA formyltransferase [Candidatus Eisenbacteria bacterium]|uniref:Methionyl-tRNA formyltransferase n=1 Tax=Eiseniibacteriota bacterium TaxID=2212470 RepID=A0A7Y2E7R5_UNCEI|nr:methionyl-tRNA formyltransferase [Candidatus Eisenbacteria bacterium]